MLSPQVPVDQPCVALNMLSNITQSPAISSSYIDWRFTNKKRSSSVTLDHTIYFSFNHLYCQCSSVLDEKKHKNKKRFIVIWHTCVKLIVWVHRMMNTYMKKKKRDGKKTIKRNAIPTDKACFWYSNGFSKSLFTSLKLHKWLETVLLNGPGKPIMDAIIRPKFRRQHFKLGLGCCICLAQLLK